MKENKYDDPTFFEQYSNMDRSKGGLQAAGEWHVLKTMLPDFKGRRVLDLGCGFGWHCIYAAEHGAERVLGLDISEKMLARARKITPFDNVEYSVMAMEDINFPDGSFDVVISSLAFHYVQDFDRIVKKIYNILSPGGDFVFSAEHPVFTAKGKQDWAYGDDGELDHWPVDRYFDQSARQAVFLGETVTKYHRTVDGYINTLLKAGFSITGFSEPEPDPALLKKHPEYADELRRPMFMIVSGKKPGHEK